MWKNMFDLTPIHTHYPDENDTDATSATSIIPGESTNLQKVMDIRYNTFKALTTGNCGSSEFAGPTGPTGGSKIQNTIEQLRKIEQQNFVIHSLCCMGKKENCFFAVLQRYEPDTAYYGATGTGGTGGNFQPQTETTPELPSGAKFYRYKWNKILFSSGISGACGSASGAGGSGNTYYPHLLEQWSLDPSEKSNDSQDATWAINLNERGLTGAYLPPGWSNTSAASGFGYRPIGAPATATFEESANIMHVARVCIEQIDPNNSVTYFWAENVVDGTC
jgi:predicted nucleic-acid-binding Zn-ribbon protein